METLTLAARRRPALRTWVIPAAVVTAAVTGLVVAQPGLSDKVLSPRGAAPDICDGSKPTTRMTPLTQRVGVGLVLVRPNALCAVDLDAGTIRWVPVDLGFHLRRSTVVRAGDAFFVGNPDGGVTRFGRDLSRPGVRFGNARDVFPSARPGRVWLWTDAGRQLREVDLAGRETMRAAPVPDSIPMAAVEGGLVLALPRAIDTASSSYTRLVVWDPRSGDTLHDLGSMLGLVDARGSVVAWLEARPYCHPCPLHLTDVRTGTDRVVDLPRADFFWIPEGRLSPDVRTLALQLSGPGSNGARHLALVDVRRAAASLVRGSEGAILSTAWSTSGRWAFFGTDRYLPPNVRALRLGSSRAEQLHFRVPGGFGGLAAF